MFVFLNIYIQIFFQAHLVNEELMIDRVASSVSTPPVHTGVFAPQGLHRTRRENAVMSMNVRPVRIVNLGFNVM